MITSDDHNWTGGTLSGTARNTTVSSAETVGLYQSISATAEVTTEVEAEDIVVERIILQEELGIINDGHRYIHECIGTTLNAHAPPILKIQIPNDTPPERVFYVLGGSDMTGGVVI